MTVILIPRASSMYFRAKRDTSNVASARIQKSTWASRSVWKISLASSSNPSFQLMVGEAGLEPATSCL
jgi:hypothetical protein